MTRARVEGLALVAALVLALVALVGLGVALGEAFAPWVGWLVLAAVAAAVAVYLGRRALDERVVARDRERYEQPVEPYQGPGADGALSMPKGYGG